VLLSGYAPLLIPAEGRIPGNKGIWVGIYCEMTEFALMFIVYFLARAHHPQAFSEGPVRLATVAGTMNTLFMVTSSWFVARAMLAIRAAAPRACLRWLFGALAMAVGYLVVKFVEFQWYGEQGIGGSTSIFFTVYYYLAFNHLVHVFWGSLGMLWVMARTWMGAYSPADHEGLEAFASYWHTIDLAWLIIFPLLYVWR
jgi:cytochrome c oxidase subunit 3